MAFSIPEVTVSGKPNRTAPPPNIIVDVKLKQKIVSDLTNYVGQAADNWWNACLHAYMVAIVQEKFESGREQTYATLGTVNEVIWAVAPLADPEFGEMYKILRIVSKMLLGGAKSIDPQIIADKDANDLLLKQFWSNAFSTINQAHDRLRSDAPAIASKIFDELLYYTADDIELAEFEKSHGMAVGQISDQDRFLTYDENGENTKLRQTVAWEYLFKVPYEQASEGLGNLVLCAVGRLRDVLKTLSAEYEESQLAREFSVPPVAGPDPIGLPIFPDPRIKLPRAPFTDLLPPFTDWIEDQPSYVAALMTIRGINYDGISGAQRDMISFSRGP